MRSLFSILTILTTFASFAPTAAQILGAVFIDKKFVPVMGESKFDDIEISEISKQMHFVVVNARAPLVDGYSYSASVSQTSERFAINPTTTGIRTVLKVTDAQANCPHRGF